MGNRRAFGYLSEISESPATENTDTPYRTTEIIQISYFDQHPDLPSWFWVLTNLFSLNLIDTDPQVAILGMPIMGILTATFGAHLAT